jgi:hypothetical protein
VISIEWAISATVSWGKATAAMAHSMVITTMEWLKEYHTREEFLSWFETEQEYIDAEFIMIVMFNFGVWISKTDLHTAHDVGSWSSGKDT